MDKLIRARSILKQVWGFDSFRRGQEDIVKSVLQRKNVIGILPTGSGKSIGYQLPALVLEGVCIVITPLIALMQDQVDTLKQLKVNASAVHSGLNKREIDRILDNCIYGNTKLLYISPERINTQLFKDRAAKMKISFVAVDEAHCISQWGHDFRPSYQKIAAIKDIDKDIKIVALTATATSKVVDDIRSNLMLRDAFIVKQSFKRENLSIDIIKSDKKLEILNSIITRSKGSGIIYVRHRKTAYELYKDLSKIVSCDFYHAGLSHKERASKQNKWLSGDIRIIIATNAFGMGIDKSNVRSVIHFGLPPSVEEYYQEIGRAGRDQKPAETFIVHSDNDINRLRTSHEKSFPVISDIRKAYSLLHNYFEIPVGDGEFRSFDLAIAHFAKYCGSNIAVVYRLLKQLEKLEFIKLSSGMKRPQSIRLLADRDLVFQLRGHYRVIAIYLLRNIENISQSSSTINTKKMAKALDMEHKTLLVELNKMSEANHINYQTATEKPFITMLQDRFAKQNLKIDEASYLKRKANEMQRYEKMIELVSSNQCRMNYILNYFEEKDATPCGKCDVCKKNEFENHTSRSDMENMVRSILNKPSTIKEIVDGYESYKHERLLTTIQYMIDAKELIYKEDRIHLN